MNVLALVAGCAGLLVSFVRWARVTQREHYLPNSCFRIGSIWFRSSPANSLILPIGVVSAVGVLVTEGLTSEVLAFVAGVSAVTFPLWMPVRGQGRPLRWTRRMSTLAVVVATTLTIVLVIITIYSSFVVAPAVVAILVPVAFEIGIRVMLPLENRIAMGYERRAEENLRRVSPRVIAVTGSWGKTTTKNHIRDLASSLASVAISPASFNNRAGLSRTANEHLPLGTDLLVVEMGMYGPGEIRDLCRWVRPDIGVITAIGPMHLERVGSIEGIVEAKSEILEGVKTAVLWVSDPRLEALSSRVGHCEVVRCGLASAQNLDVTVELSQEGLAVWVGGAKIGSTHANSGLHPANVGCAVGALIAAGFDMSRVGQALSELRPPEHRASAARDPKGILVIDDTFNSNPAGARAALGRLNTVVAGRRVVVTPGMMELGPVQHEANRGFAREVVETGVELVVVGKTNHSSLAAGAADAGVEPLWFRNRSQAVGWVAEHLVNGDGVLWENDLPDHYP